VYGPDIVLTAAYYEQVNEIGWFHFCLGCLSTKWSTAVQMYSKAAGTMVDSTRWASLAIQVTWQYMKTLQKYRNELVHGSTVEEEVEKKLQDLHNHVCHHYACFEQNNNYVLHAHLFTQKSDQHRLQMSWMKHYLFCVLKRIIYVKLRASFPPPLFSLLGNEDTTPSDVTSNSSYTPSYQSDFTDHDTSTTLSLTTSSDSSDDFSFSTTSSHNIELDGFFNVHDIPNSSNKPLTSSTSHHSKLSDATTDWSSTTNLTNNSKEHSYLTNSNTNSYNERMVSSISTLFTSSDNSSRSSSINSITSDTTVTMNLTTAPRGTPI
jgi:hypothetical protein